MTALASSDPATVPPTLASCRQYAVSLGAVQRSLLHHIDALPVQPQVAQHTCYVDYQTFRLAAQRSEIARAQLARLPSLVDATTTTSTAL
jgi:hypothetical protein